MAATDSSHISGLSTPLVPEFIPVKEPSTTLLRPQGEDPDPECGLEESVEDVASDNVIKSPPDMLKLWQIAFDTADFTDEQRAALKLSNEFDNRITSPQSLIEEIITLTKRKCTDYENSGWSIQSESGQKEIRVCEKAKVVLRSVLEYKALIDASFKFDATGYGNTACSVVSFGLQVSILLQCYPSD